jgi:HTH-type transcriptional repressor of NAD biosynthesis genes
VRFARGLVVGKFSPLHRGHERLIGRALEECAQVVIVSYANPERALCSAERRERWLAELYPQARRLVATPERVAAWFPDAPVLPHDDAPEIDHRRFCGRLLRDVLRTSVEAVYTSEDYGDGFAAELTKFFRETEVAHPTVVHVAVDPQRIAIPICATAIRGDVHAQRQWLPANVYADFVQRICLLGGESSGKSTLAAALADRLGTAYTTEYGRDLWIERGGRLEFADYVHIARTQVAMEEARAAEASRSLVCDTSPLTTLFYCLDQFGHADPELESLAARRYDVTVLCAPDFPFVQDGARRDDAFRHAQHQWYMQRLSQAGVSWVDACGPLEVRLASLEAALSFPGRDPAA